MALELIDGKFFSVYGLMGVTGFMLGFVFLVFACRLKKVSFEDAIYIYVWAGVFTIIGAKLLYLVLDVEYIIYAFEIGGDYLRNYLRSVISGGLVFYGGLAGGLFGVWLSAKFFKKDFRTMLTLVIPTLPLAHAFGRIGCHLVGCCYGKAVIHGPAKVYTDSLFAPNNIKLFPVQLTESICDFVIFASLSVIYFGTPKEKLKDSIIPEIYLISYSVVRFILEFLRGDIARGHFLMFSTSQWISIVFFVGTGMELMRRSGIRNRMRKK